MGMALAVPRYSIDDLERMPEDGNRYEVLDGVLLVTPQPRRMHDIVVSRLFEGLIDLARKPRVANVFPSGAVELPPWTQLQPDLLVQPARFERETQWSKVTEHWLAVEVLSRGSRVYDREFKRDAYLALGVQEVWLVDIENKQVEVCRGPGKSETIRDVILWRVPTTDREVAIDLADLFEGIA